MNRTLLASVCTLVFIVAIYFTAVYVDKAQDDDKSLGFIVASGSPGKSFVPMIYNGIAMLLGIMFGFFYNRFAELQRAGIQKVNPKAELKTLFTATAFYLALAASPVVFGIVMIASKGVSLLAAIFLAFQNGFFWQNVMPKQPVPVPDQTTNVQP